jgi:hypothetical protein
MSMTDEQIEDYLDNRLPDDLQGISVVKGEPGRNGVPSVSECLTCGLPLPKEGEPGYHVQRKYHNDCRPAKPKGKKKPSIGPDGDAQLPPRVVNNFNVKTSSSAKSKIEPDLKAVEEGAAYMLGFAPMILAVLGDSVCPDVIAAAIPDIARQLALLSKYHPAIKKIFVSGEGTGEMMAWIGLVITISPVIIAVLAHHDLLKGKVGDRIATAVAFTGLLANQVNDPEV